MRGVLNGDIYTKQEQEKNKLRMAGGGWTINLDDLPEAADVIVYVTSEHSYTIQREDAFENGFIRMFNGEKKLVVPEKHWWIE